MWVEDDPKALSRYATIGEIVAEYQTCEREISEAFGRVSLAVHRLNDTFTMQNHASISVRDRFSHSMNFDDPTDTIETLRRDVWSALVERLELCRMMSIQRAKDLDEQLRRSELPDITIESVTAFAQGYIGQLPEMLGEAIEEVFDTDPSTWPGRLARAITT